MRVTVLALALALALALTLTPSLTLTLSRPRCCFDFFLVCASLLDQFFFELLMTLLPG